MMMIHRMMASHCITKTMSYGDRIRDDLVAITDPE